MRIFQKLPVSEPLFRNEENDTRLIQYLSSEIETGYGARHEQEQNWLECLRQYEGVPKNPYRNVPIENSPNIEITLGAIASDALYAQVISNIFSVSPILTVRATRRANEFPNMVTAAAGLQDFADWGVANEWGLRQAANHTFLDAVQLGTGVFYTPHIEIVKRTGTRTVIDYGPRIRAIPIEDFLAPGGSGAILDELPWVDLRFWMTHGELQEYRKADDKAARWKIKDLKPVASVDYVRQRREALGRSSTTEMSATLYEMHFSFVSYDYDQDGMDEELLCIWDRTARKIAWLGYSPHDTRPIDYCVYHPRAHLLNGLGVLEMLKPYQEELSEEHNDRTLNAKLANMRFFVSRTGTIDEATISAWAGRNIETQNPKEDLVAMQLGEVYPSAIASEQITLSLAERRVGVNELNTPRPSQVLGSRTPAFTTASLLQQQSNRFAPAYDNMKDAAASAVRQCLWRYHERLLIEDDDGPAATNIKAVLGEERGSLVIALLRTDDFQQSVSVELTASSAQINRDSERQNAMLLVNILGTYYQRIMELITLASQPGIPQPIAEVAKKIAEAWSNIIERTVRTFDQVRDPNAFIVEVSEELDSIKDLNQPGLQGLAQLIGGLGQAAGDNGLGQPPPVQQ